MERGFDSGWIGAGPEDDLDRSLAAEEEPFDLRRPHVMTALGPIEPGALGVTLLQTNLVADGREAAPDSIPTVDLGHVLLADLEDLYAAGGRAVVAAATGAARDVEPVLWVAARAPVHVVATTTIGANSLAEASTGARPNTTSAADELAAGFVRELTAGIAGTAARAGAIAVGTEATTASGVQEVVVRAVAQGYAATGAPVIMRLDQGVPMTPVVARLLAEGVAPDRMVVAADGANAVADQLASLADLDVFVAVGPGSGGEAVGADGWGELAAAVARLATAGLGDRLLLAGGPIRASSSRAGRGLGLAAPLDRLPLALMDAGLDAPAVRRLLVDNPARALTIGTEAE